MTGDLRAFSESLLVHGLLAATLITATLFIRPHVQEVRLDLSLIEQVIEPVQHLEEKTSQVENIVPQPPPEATPVEPKVKPIITKPKLKPKTTPVEEKKVEEVATKIVEGPPEQPVSEEVAQEAATPSPSTGSPLANQAASLEHEYRQHNFAAIRDSILANLSYPMLARRKGWSGKVDVAFLVKPDGSIDQLRIISSSGYPVLDDQAIDAIRRAAPFTPPRVIAHLVMPINFSLN